MSVKDRDSLSRFTLGSAAALMLHSNVVLADYFIVCAETGDADQTRAVISSIAEKLEFEIVTPEHTWEAPDLPGTETHVSPNLIGQQDVTVSIIRDKEGVLRVIDFGVEHPDALSLEGLRGSLVLHETFDTDKALGSLYYRATGNLVSITPLVCEYIVYD